MDYSATIASELRGWRSKRDETQLEVARAVGANTSTVSAWERRGGIGLADAWRLADHYGVTIDELAGRSSKGVVRC